MAQMYNGPLRPGAPRSERETLKAARGLPDDWYVLPEQQWARGLNNEERHSDSDLILFHALYGIVFLEVKGGTVSIDRGVWYSTPRGQSQRKRIKHPYLQARDSMHAIIDFLRKDVGIPARIAATYGVALPGTPPNDALRQHSWDGGPVLTLYPEDLLDLESVLVGKLGTWRKTPLEDKHVTAVVNALAPSHSFELRLPSVARVKDAELMTYTRTIIRFTEKQLEVSQRLQATPSSEGGRRAIVYGGAGTGKTIMALHTLKRLAESNPDGQAVLLCHRAEMSKHLNSMIGPSKNKRVAIALSSIGALCRRVRAGESLTPSERLSEWRTKRPRNEADPGPVWQQQSGITPEDLAHFFVETASHNGALPPIVIDEAQEFPEAFLRVVSDAADEHRSPLYLFADPFQRAGVTVRNKRALHPWKPPFDEPSAVLPENCRNTTEIARMLERVRPDVAPASSVSGPEVRLRVVTPDRLVGTTIKATSALLSDGFSRSEVVVLVAGASKENLAGFRRALGGQKTTSGVRVLGSEQFKGLEETAVVAVLPWLTPPDEWSRAHAYIALSRARSVLHVVGSRQAFVGLNI